jgi:hypothetical protein
MSKSKVNGPEGRETIEDPVTELLRVGAQQLIQRAVETELAELLSHHGDRRTETGNAGVVRNGYLPERELQTGLGPVTVQIPKVRAKTGEAVTFRSALVPPYIRKTKSMEAAVPWLYLKGVSSGEMGDALRVLVGPKVQGLSASTVSRLKQVWAQEYRIGCDQRLDADRWVYVWADGIYSGLRAEQTKLCALVVIGVNERGEKRFLAIEDGVRESTQSWREVLLKLKSRGMNIPELAIGDGAMGFWAALEEIYPETRQQRCWMHIVGRDPRLPEGWNVPSRVNPYEPGSLGSGAAEQSAVSKQTRHVSLRTQSGGTGKRSGRTERECMAPSWHLGRVLLGESGNGVVESPVFRRRQQRLRMHRDKKQSSPPAFRATA